MRFFVAVLTDILQVRICDGSARRTSPSLNKQILWLVNIKQRAQSRQKRLLCLKKKQNEYHFLSIPVIFFFLFLFFFFRNRKNNVFCLHARIPDAIFASDNLIEGPPGLY